MYTDRYWNDDNLAATEAFSGIAREAGISLIDMSMRFVANRPGVNCVLLGVSKPEQLLQNLSSILAEPLDEGTLSAIDDVYQKLPLGTRFKYYR